MSAAMFAPEFACPSAGDSTDIVETLARTRFDATKRVVVRALSDAGMITTADQLAAISEPDGNTWRPETGLAQSASTQGRHDIAALQLTLANAGSGGVGSVEVEVEGEDLLFFDGWLMPVAGTSRVRADNDAVRISSGANELKFSRKQGHWVPTDEAPLIWNVHSTDVRIGPKYISRTSLKNSAHGFPWPSTQGAASIQPTVKRDASEKIATIRAACELLAEHSRGYSSWMANTATGVLLLDSGGLNTASSNSGFDHPGLIALDPPECPVHCGELFVNECTRQHLLIYMMVAELVANGHGEIFYSPVKRTYMTTRRSLANAHIVGNLILYYRDLERARKLDRASRERYWLHHIAFAEECVPALDGSRQLTEAGTAMWNQIREAVLE